MTQISEIFANMTYGPALESEAPARSWIDAHGGIFGHFIGGAWEGNEEGGLLSAISPATGEPLAQLALGSAVDVDRAVRAARAAQPQWASRSGHERAKTLYALARLLQKNSRTLSIIEALDNGKPLRETRDIDLPLAIRHFYYHAGCAQILDRLKPGAMPLGVVGQVIPWNFPLLMLAWKVAPALACGNTVVVKPAEQTSLSALFFAQLCEEAGVPAGVVNIVTGAGATGAALVEHPDVDKVAFTGSTEVGRLIREGTAGSGKKLSLELGGKSPFIVLEDADLDSAVEGIIDSIFLNQGEVCCAGSRLLVQEGVAERLVAKLKTRLSTFRVGHPLDKTVDMGALVDAGQKARVEALVADARAEGADVWTAPVALPAEGSYCAPTLLSGTGTSAAAWREEIFGPVLTIVTFRSVSEAIQLANNTRYGLAASVWSESSAEALRIAREVRCGVVWINAANQFDAACPFGGDRDSGFGREGGLVGLEEYLRTGPALRDGNVCMPQVEISGAVAGDLIDRTAKHYIGGKQVRPDDGQMLPVATHNGGRAGSVANGSRKDIRDAVEAASGAGGWSQCSGHQRAQVLYYLAENLAARRDDFARRIADQTGRGAKDAAREVDLAIERLFDAGAWADKVDGSTTQNAVSGLAMVVPQAMGVVGILCPDTHPLLALATLAGGAIASGNSCVVVPSNRYPLIAVDFYQLLEASDIPAGVVNVVTGLRDTLASVLASHHEVDALWYHGQKAGAEAVEAQSAAALKPVWSNLGQVLDWEEDGAVIMEWLVRLGTRTKTIWLP